MGPVQLEVLTRLIRDRFGLEAAFSTGSILYKETIAAPVVGVGHFEPLRHYAEVHLLLEPAPRGSGLHLATACPEDVLDRNWQRLIFTHLMEKEHLGVLTGSPLTDVTITLLTGRAHVKHTEGGDFRQATYRAVRQGLMQAESVLLEPWYDLRLLLPPDQVGRAMSDLQRMGGELQAPEVLGDMTLLTGSAPVSGLQDYAAQVAAYTRGMGRLTLTPAGYRPCPNQTEIVAQIGYDVERDVENTPRLGVLRPRGRVHRQVGPGEGPHAPGQRPGFWGTGGGLRSRCPAPAPKGLGVLRLPGGGRRAHGHLRTHLRPRPAPGLPAPGQAEAAGRAPGKTGHQDPGGPGPGVSLGGRVQHHLRLGRAEGHRPGQPGRRPAEAHGPDEQLPGL